MFDDLLVVLEKLTDFEGQVQGAIPVQYMDIWALVCQVISDDHLRGGEVKGRVNGEEDNANWVSVETATPLEYVICTDKERGMGETVV